MKPDANKHRRISPAQHLWLVKRMRSYSDYLERCGIPPRARFKQAMRCGRELHAEIK